MRSGSIAAIVLAFSIMSCAPTSESTKFDLGNATSGQVSSLMIAADARLQTLHGKGSLTFESSEMSGTANFDVSLRKPDSLLVELEGPFGIQVGTFLLSPSHFVLYNSLQNTVQSGTPSAGSLRSLIPIELTPAQIIAAFSGSFPIPSTSPESMTRDGDAFRQEYRTESGRAYVWIDSGTLLVRKFRFDDATGVALVEGETSGIIEHDGARIPRRIVLTIPNEERRIAIAFSTAELNDGKISFSYSVPSSARSGE